MTLTETAYSHIQEQIVSGELLPGTVVSENTLARALGISRTPVGEAIRRLSAEGLLEQIPRYGTVVREIGREELCELYEMREALESYAAGRAAGKVTEQQLGQLQCLLDMMRRVGGEAEAASIRELNAGMLKRFLAADMAFHMLILEIGGNMRMVEVVKTTRTVSRIFRTRRQAHDLSIVHEAHDFHARILAALRSGDAEEARRTMLEHISMSRDEALDAFDRQGASEDTPSTALQELPDDMLEELSRIDGNRRL